MRFCLTRIPQKTTQRLLLQPQNARKIQHNIFNASYETHVTNINNYQHKLNTLFYILLQRNSNANKIFSIIKSRLKLTESFNDQKRTLKFQKLLKQKTPFDASPTVIIYNLTHKSLPENIQNILSKGLHQPVGGRTNKNIILTKFECFFNSWHAYALKQRLDIFKITKIRSQLFLEFCKFVNCTTKTRSDELKKYLDSEPELLICPSDKTKNINIISHTSYLQK